MATKRFKDGAWRYTVKRKNLLQKPIYLSFHDEAEGDRYVHKLEALLDKGIIPDGLIKKKTRTLGNIISDYQDMNSVKPDDNAILNLIFKTDRNQPISELTYNWAETWVQKMKRQDNLSPGTIRHYVGALARCLDWALAKEYLTINPLRQLPKGYAQYTDIDARHADRKVDVENDRRLEPGEEEKIRATLTGDIALYFEIGLETAMRLSEIYSLTLDQIDLDRRTIFLDKTKNGHKRQVPISSTLLAVLRPLTEYPTYPKSKTNTARFSKQFTRAVKDVAPGFTFHCLRHEATSRLFERTTLTELEIMKITGHSGTRVLARYANLRASNLADKLW